MPIHLLHADTYLAMIRGSINSQAYRHAYAMIEGEKTDVVKNGEYSCAFFASDILLRFALLKEPHLRVQGTIVDLRASGWIETPTPKVGDVLIWEALREPDGQEHLHIGFFISHDQAVSNRPTEGSPQEHHWTFGTTIDGSPTRQITRIFTHPTFFQEASYR